MFKDIREVWGRYAPSMAAKHFLRPISFKPKPYQNDEMTRPKFTGSNWSNQFLLVKFYPDLGFGCQYDRGIYH